MKQHGIIGNTQIEDVLDPEITSGVEEAALVEEKNMAKFSRTREFKRLKGYIEGRVGYYQTFLPDGRIVGTAAKGTAIPTPEEWATANTIISEFTALISEYENAAQAIQEAKRAD